MSFWESPCAAKREVRLARPDVGGGMLLLAPLRLAVRESLRPTFTSQLGPPSCTIKCTYMQILSIVVTVSFPIIISKCLGTYDNDAVPCSDGEDVGTGDMPGQGCECSRWDLISSTTSKLRSELLGSGVRRPSRSRRKAWHRRGGPNY